MAERNGGDLLSFLFGALIGFAAGILVAPRPGKETRELLMEKAKEFTEEGQKLYESQRERVEEIIETGKETFGEKVEAAKEKISQAKEKIQEKVETLRGKEAVEEIKPDEV